MEAESRPRIFVAAARNPVRWIIHHDQDAQDLVQEACYPRISAVAKAHCVSSNKLGGPHWGAIKQSEETGYF
jgi:hypothetical protein